MPRRYAVLIVVLALGGWFGSRAHSADDPSRKGDEQAIRAAARQYIEALKSGDTKTMRASWVPEGDIVDEFGNATPALESLEREAETRRSREKEDGGAVSEVKLTESSIRFLTPDVAIEDGGVEVALPETGLPPRRGRYVAIWVKADERWRLASLRESRVPPTTANDMAGLDWMVGDWSGEVGNARFHFSARWNEKQTYLERDLTVTQDGKVIFSGSQLIGVDPLDGKIRSWMHDSDGGHGEGIWTKHGDAWVVQANGVTPNGRPTTATNVYTRDGKDLIIWKSTGGFSHGHRVPDFELKLQRIGATEN